MPGAQVEADIWVSEFISPYDVYQHGVREIFLAKRTAFQSMAVVDFGTYGRGLVLDGKVQCTSGDEVQYHEPLCHVPCLVHGAPRQVLILGGGDGGAAREFLKWRTVERVVVVDIDAEVVTACREHLPEIHRGSLDDARVEVVTEDAWAYVDRCGERFEVIVSDLTDPLEDGPSFALFAREFFQRVKRLLTPEGVFVTQAGPTSAAESPMHPRIVSTLRSVYQHASSYEVFVPTFGSPLGFAIASERAFDTFGEQVVERVNRRLVENVAGGKLQTLDGIAFVGLFATSKALRQRIEAERTVYTLASDGKSPDTIIGSAQADANRGE
ncbi:hypothetical protein CDCA_CDCA14G3848 [Cyanidium caldarium]|uniref:thermospermine synthase n=1 Tax=Cyanidium caldarium TaxID=2771 RepID=A0AAV9IZR0_CYACA|nr:hypothetical protein CDCA_CDCA14G3848 [Cyanidium caldarium]